MEDKAQVTSRGPQHARSLRQSVGNGLRVACIGRPTTQGAAAEQRELSGAIAINEN